MVFMNPLRVFVVLFILIVPLLQGCSKSESTYSEAERRRLTEQSRFVALASYTGTERLTDRALIDVFDKRPGFGDKIEQGVLFRLKEFIKGSYGKDTLMVGVHVPSLAFGIKPGEYAGQKIYTLYVGYDQETRREVLLGAEWVPREY